MGRTAIVMCVLVVALSARAVWSEGVSSLLRKPTAEAAAAESVPVLRVLDSSGGLRWQLPVVLWATPKPEFGGYHYPGAVATDRPLRIGGPLVFVGYGLTREDWDDYGGQRIDGGIAVVFMGEAPRKVGAEAATIKDAKVWQRLVQEKVDNAKEHGAVAILLERSPLLPPCEGCRPTEITDLPMAAPTIRCWRAERLSLPTLSLGTTLVEVIVAQTSDLFGSGTTTGEHGLKYLMQDARDLGRGLGPLPLGLRAEVRWEGGQMQRQAGERCDLWYQPGAPAERDLEVLSRAAEDTLRSLESLLSAKVGERVTILLFADWRSKLVATGHLGWGAAGGTRMAMVYEGGDPKANGTLAHELCHLVASEVGNPPACLGEGLGHLVGSTLGDLGLVHSETLEADVVTAGNLREGKLWSLKDLLELPDIGPPESRSAIAYPEAASFCAYLIRRVGFDGFRDLYASMRAKEFAGNAELLQKACGADLESIEADWHRAILGAAELGSASARATGALTRQ